MDIVRVAAFIIALSVARVATAGAPQERAVLTVVQQLVDAWREPNVSKAAEVLHENYRAESWQISEQRRSVFLETRDHLLAQISALRPGQWDVRFLRTAVHVDPNGLAVVWAKYVFYSEGRPNHCGYESYTLLQTQPGWKVVNFADTDTPLRGRSVSAVCGG
jgi:hypothetical protein